MEHLRLDCRGPEGLDQAESRPHVGGSRTQEAEAHGARPQPQCPALVSCHGGCVGLVFEVVVWYSAGFLEK